MKNIFFVVSIFWFLLNFQAYSLEISIIKKNTSEKGCNSSEEIFEINDDDKSNSLITLRCEGEGTNQCEFTRDPCKSIYKVDLTWSELSKYADSQIKNGVLKGEYEKNIAVDSKLWFRRVEWNGENIYNCTIKITLYQIKP